MIRGPCQPCGHDFPRTKGRRICSAWFDQYGNWLDYSVKANKVFCLVCYLFRDSFAKQGGSNAFVSEGFNSCETDRFFRLVGDVSSFHNRALKNCEDLIRQDQSIALPFINKMIL